MLYLKLSYPARARLYLDRSLAADPTHVPTLEELVRANRSLGAEPLAQAHLARLRELAPAHPLVQRSTL